MHDVFYYNSKPNLFPFEKPADSLAHAASLSRTEFFWYLDGNHDYSNFDFDQHLLPWESSYLHVFKNSTCNNLGVFFGTRESVAANQQHYIDSKIKAGKYDIFYYNAKPEIFSQAMPAESLSQAASLSSTEFFWYLDGSHDYSNFDFSWSPDYTRREYLHVFKNSTCNNLGVFFGSKHAAVSGPEHYVDSNIKPSSLEIFFVCTGAESDSKIHHLKARGLTVHTIRYYENWLSTLARCARKAASELVWVISDLNDYSNFDFDWCPDYTQRGYIHVFPDQWQQDANVYLVNVKELIGNMSWVTHLQNYPNLNYVSGHKVLRDTPAAPLYQITYGSESVNTPGVNRVRFVDSYLATFRRIVTSSTTPYIWITSSLCNYSSFDFTWHPSVWQDNMIHCFGTKLQPKGDTFFINVKSFKDQMDSIELLDWFKVICYHESSTIVRSPVPVVYYDSDNLVSKIKTHTFTAPYTLFANSSAENTIEPCLWRLEDRPIMPLTADNGTVLVPKDVVQYLRTQLYDYPYIDFSCRSIKSDPLDVIFISNGEPLADKHWARLKEVCPRAKRSDGINGRVLAYQAAARLSTTKWFFAVFAKIEVNEDFDFDWQPDMLQEPRHYVFHSTNPVNGLEYGHQAIVAYNTGLVLATNAPGIDFTLSQLHSVVPVNSGVAVFNQDAWTTWRTAFREVVKLHLYNSVSPTVETSYRLKIWTTRAQGEFADWCLRGAVDAEEYFKAANGDHSKLMLTFEWDWLKDFYKARY